MIYDAIVIGLGGMGSAAAYELARRGRRVLGLEQFEFVHRRGSSHGRSRIIRKAYYEHPSYVPLVLRAYEKWYDLEQLLGQRLLTECACLTLGPAGGELVTGVLSAAAEHNLELRELTPRQRRLAYPAFAVPEHYAALVEPGAGILAVEECVRAQLDAAVQFGAELHEKENVLAWMIENDSAIVQTDRGQYVAKKLIVAAGAWAGHLLRDLGVPLTVMRQVQLWFRPHRPAMFRRDRFPVFLLDAPEGAFYGMPMLDDLSVKLAQHYGAPELAGPGDVDWTSHKADEVPVRQFADRYLPGQLGELSSAEVCQYTLSPDRHFIIDVHPQFSNVSFACGFSGHGFKFASAVGEVLADLAERGETEHDIALFRIARFKPRGID
jgi:sarcosine oxidase